MLRCFTHTTHMYLNQVSECFRLNTPPPIMSTCIAPPIRADPFRSALHHCRDLGSSTLKVNPLVPPAQLCQVVVQLTQDEDQAITNLLKLHHQEPPLRNETIDASLKYPLSSLVQHQPADAGSGVMLSRKARCWSVQEIEAANTLSCFGLMEKEQNVGAGTGPPPDFPSAQSHGGSAGGTDTIHLPLCEKPFTLAPSQEWQGLSEREQTLSDSERDALQALQSLADAAAVNPVFNLHS